MSSINQTTDGASAVDGLAPRGWARNVKELSSAAALILFLGMTIYYMQKTHDSFMSFVQVMIDKQDLQTEKTLLRYDQIVEAQRQNIQRLWDSLNTTNHSVAGLTNSVNQFIEIQREVKDDIKRLTESTKTLGRKADELGKPPNGAGRTSDDPPSCPDCDGTGQIFSEDVGGRMVCPACTGSLKKGVRKCLVCGKEAGWQTGKYAGPVWCCSDRCRDACYGD